jgi:hypothetical protein
LTRQASEVVDGNLSFRAATIRHQAQDGRIAASVQIENISDKKISISYASRTTSGFDDQGNSYFATRIDGIHVCSTTKITSNCLNPATSLSPGDIAYVTYEFYVEDRWVDGEVLETFNGSDMERPSLFSMSSAF